MENNTVIFCQQRIQIPDILIAALERNKWAAKDLKINLFRNFWGSLQKPFRFKFQNKNTENQYTIDALG